MGTRQAKVPKSGDSPSPSHGIGVPDFSSGLVDATVRRPASQPSEDEAVAPAVRTPEAKAPRVLIRNGREMDHIIIQFNTYVPLDLVQRPAAEKVWEVFATDGPGRGCRPAAMADLVRLDVEAHGVTAVFPDNVEIFVPNTAYMAVAGHPKA